MQRNNLFSHIHTLIIAISVAVLLSSCGGGGGGGGGGVDVASASITGAAATGAPVDGFVYVTDSNGMEANAPVNPDGTFSVSVDGMTPPYLLRVVPNDGGEILYSFASVQNITVNITPLTSLALYLAYGGDLSALYDAWAANIDALDDDAIASKQEMINANLLALFGNHGIDATFYNFMNTAFNADSTGIDGVLDSLAISIDFDGNDFTVEIDGEAFIWNPAADTSDINIGDFSIPGSSNWQLTISDPGNNINSVEIVPGVVVPNDLDEFEGIGFEQLTGVFVVEGIEITFDLALDGFFVAGNGEVGTTITGHISGNIHIVGEADGQQINETVILNTTFGWERLADTI